ncbi:MAG: DbpA RNA binding domain-containing protein [Deltaproteobacteria bacterium]|nr:DbpA RNA binding domain-containing protein [Deltaproteobacteria bacterium]
MQEETTNTELPSQDKKGTVDHRHYEAGRELLAKPTLLGELVEIQAGVPILVYCNTPSDTDFVEVMLKKRGVSAQKLIGNVPAPRLQRAEEQVKSGEIQVIVLTDIAARSLDQSLFEVVINYSVPPDVDTYHIRSGRDNDAAAFSKVLTLVSPLELANFLSLKKTHGLDIPKGEQPSAEELEKAQTDNLAVKASKEQGAGEEKTRRLANLILTHEKRDEIVALLVHNSFTVIPGLRAAIGKAEAEEEYDYDDDRGNSDRGERGDRGRSRGERGGRQQRGSRDSFRRGRGRDDYGDQESYEGLPADAYESGDEEVRDHGNRSGGGRGLRKRGQRGSSGPARKDTRVYLGAGLTQNLSKDGLLELIESRCDLPRSEIKHVSIRSNCAFFDLPEEQAEQVLEKLNSVGDFSGHPLMPKKAISINAVVPESSNGEHASDGGAADEALIGESADDEGGSSEGGSLSSDNGSEEDYLA